MAESYQTVFIQSVSFNGPSASFGPVVFNEYSDDVSVSFNSTSVFARTNPIYTYTENTRNINCTFTFPLDTTIGLRDIDRVAKMMYPSISGSIYKDAPLVRAKFGNFHESPILGFFKNVRYEYSSPDKMGNFPLSFSPVVIPRYIKLSLSLTVIAQEPISSNNTARIFAPVPRSTR